MSNAESRNFPVGTTTPTMRRYVNVGREKVFLKIPNIQQAFSIAHLTDLHLCECDERDAPDIQRMANRNRECGGNTCQTATRLFSQCNEAKVDFVAVTGDLLDSSTAANIDCAAKLLRSLKMPVGLVNGNHEWFSAVEPSTRTAWMIERFASWPVKPLDWQRFDLYGVDLIFIDNSDYQITERQLSLTQQVLSKAQPCLLFTHIPISQPSLREPTIRRWQHPILMADPDAPLDGRRLWTMGDHDEPSTLAFCRLIETTSTVKALFSGHVHFSHGDAFSGGCYQYVTSAGFMGSSRQIFVQPS